jgi:hypothetical protein
VNPSKYLTVPAFPQNCCTISTVGFLGGFQSDQNLNRGEAEIAALARRRQGR